ncbi:Tn3 family transposase [Kitasatospora purpeofusca]|uniref:Tn3 family transposase n=1 Tax=Kitasatospora purpeofusca TaxID=67352 RepID=UPI0012FEFA24|nr:Tn3 family transposase [Kitasatospora purpeofusca]
MSDTSVAARILRLADEPGYRRQIRTLANLQEGRHALARKIFRPENVRKCSPPSPEAIAGATSLLAPATADAHR